MQQNNNSKALFYNIISKSANKLLEVSQDPHFGYLRLWENTGTDNQKFYLIQDGINTYIQSKKSKKYLTITENSQQGGTLIRQESYCNSIGQIFRIQSISPQSQQCIIYTFCGKALDCFEDGTKNGTKIIQWDFHGDDNQKWIFKAVS